MTATLSATSQPFHFVILGGGTAGWMAALLFADKWLKPAAANQRAVTITLLEAPDIGIIGVGEGSTPSLKRFFQKLGIPDNEWMPACQATYKTNIRFVNWSPAAQVMGLGADYSHPFISQPDLHSETAFYSNCFKRRLGLAVETSPEKFLLNGYLAAEKLAPLPSANFPFRIEYGYHFDSGLLGQFLKQKALALGVNYHAMTVTQVNQLSDGCIGSLTGETADGGAKVTQVISADFFVDCTGFRSSLLQQTLQVPFESFASNLFNDAAVVLPTDAFAMPPVETRATALSNGWAWQIPLRHRTGNGYVYSSAFIAKDAAELELRQHLGLPDTEVNARHLQMKVGQVSRSWEKNCLALGLSQGFIEPLEATALHLVQSSIEQFIDAFADFTAKGQAEFNRQVHQRFEAVRDYIVAHYKLSSRSDSHYWRANSSNMQLSESLRQILDVWFRQGDLANEIARQQLDSHFGATSWHCLLAGYGVFPPLRQPQPAGVSDAFTELQLAAFFQGCSLNFQPQHLLWRAE
ncbi:MAG: tryptophan 7-halogenase [Rheinheimera sp.]|nr:MAG: tryptophan 7-halogenase [Rheinheimera sp.]